MSLRFECHAHTEYSNIRLVDSTNKVEALIDRAIEIGLAGIAVTDHECLSGSIRVNQYAKKIKDKYPDFKVAIGNEIYLVDERPNDSHYHCILLAKDAEGHRQLRYLSSIAWINSYFAKGIERVDTLKKDLERVISAEPGHVIMSSACLGSEVDKLILVLTKAEKENDEQARQLAHSRLVDFILWAKGLFGEDFYLEVQPAQSKEQIIVNRRMLSIAQCFNVKIIVTCDAHYLTKNDRFVHKAFLNSKQGDREVDSFYEYTYLQTNDEIIENLAASDYDQMFVEKLFENTMEIFDKIEFYDLEYPQQIPHVDITDYPKKEVPQELTNYDELSKMFNSDDKTDRYWINQCWDKLTVLLKDKDDIDKKRYIDELEEEAEVKSTVGKKLGTNMFGYPILLQHYIDLIWDCGSTIGAGRGSACAALNHMLLGVTQLDPLQWNFPFFRYMNRETVGLGDIDIDICPSKRSTIIKHIKEERRHMINEDLDDLSKNNLGCTYVATFGTETTKSAILTACRGYRSEDYPDGIDVDEAQYLSSLIPQERGFVWNLKDVTEGNPEKGRKPVQAFIQYVSAFPGLLKIMKGIEGLISRRGIHASGVIMFDNDPYEHCCFMRAPNGEITTQYDLHDAEWNGLTKLDLLVTEIQDKITETIHLLQKDDIIDPSLTLRQAYDLYLHPNVLPLDDPKAWKVIQEASVLDLFQFDSPIGRQGAKQVAPKNLWEMSSANGLIRLMGEEGEERPMEKYVRYKANLQLWRDEMESYGLNDKEKIAVGKHLDSTYGVGISQEQLMRVLMEPDLCGFSLAEANAARKVVSKKKMDKIAELKEKVFASVRNKEVGTYIWKAVVSGQLGYSFSDIHSLSYSAIGYQSAYLATHWNPIYWNTACLIVNSGSLESIDDEEKKKNTDYAKIAKAIGAITSQGIKVSLVDINSSDLSFSPDIANGQIRFGLKGLSQVNDDTVAEIIKHRPYTGIKDFMKRCPLKKTSMISLIKGGAFDELDKEWASKISAEPRYAIMAYYLSQVADLKSKITLQNLNGLIQHNLVPPEYSETVRIVNFNKYLKNNKYKDYFVLDIPCMNFYTSRFDTSYIEQEDNKYLISIDNWKRVYEDNCAAVFRKWIVNNQQQILSDYNGILFKEMWDKYAEGNVSSWEMDACCFYYHPHELIDVNMGKYGISDFFKLPEQPRIEYMWRKTIPIYELYKIIGTVISKDDTRSTVSLLTITGVVNVKFSKEYYANFKKKLSKKNEDGTKTYIEDGWFSKGNKLMITGYRNGDDFRAKTYSKTGGHQLYLITNVDGRNIELTHERAETE